MSTNSERAAAERQWWAELHDMADDKELAAFYRHYAAYLKWNNVISDARKTLLRMALLLVDTIETQERTIEACRRYFEHCERVSVSARGKGCDSAEMSVRMALHREARDAIG